MIKLKKQAFFDEFKTNFYKFQFADLWDFNKSMRFFKKYKLNFAKIIKFNKRFLVKNLRRIFKSRYAFYNSFRIRRIFFKKFTKQFWSNSSFYNQRFFGRIFFKNLKNLKIKKCFPLKIIFFKHLYYLRHHFYIVGKKIFSKFYINFIRLYFVSLNNLFKFFKFKKILFNILVSASSINVHILLSYMFIQLRKGFSINQVLRFVCSGLNKIKFFCTGLKICFSGRFTRRQIATYRFVKFGILHYSNLGRSMNYVSGMGVSSFGACGIKIWLQM